MADEAFVEIAEIQPIAPQRPMTEAEHAAFASDDDYWWQGERINKAEYLRRKANATYYGDAPLTVDDFALVVNRPETSDPYTLEADSLRDAADWCWYKLRQLQDISLPLTAEDELAGRWWTRMRERLIARADKLLYSNGLPKTEQQAHALLKMVGGQLRDAGLALDRAASELNVGSSRVDLQACKLEYSIVSPK